MPLKTEITKPLEEFTKVKILTYIQTDRQNTDRNTAAPMKTNVETNEQDHSAFFFSFYILN